MKKSFEEVFEDKTKYGTKIKASEYHNNGRYLIIDQGQADIAGYTNLEDGLFKDVPVIIFGDHTRVIKYVEEPFFLGADGTKILRSKIPDANYKYLYYALKNAKIPNTGYNRHFKWLKDVKIQYYDTSTQTKIVNILDKINGVIEARQQEIRKLNDLIKARFVEFFGDTVTNPLEWEEHRLDEYIEFLTSGSREWAQYFVNEENDLFITIKNVKNNHITLENIQYIEAPDNKEAERTKVKAGDLLISITADLGRTGVVDEDIAERGAYINQHLSLVRLDKTQVNPLYVSHFLETEGGKMQFESKNQNGVKAGLNFEAIKSLKILVPPLEMQESYLDFVKATDKSKFQESTRFHACFPK